MTFKLTASIEAFPSDNKLDSMPRRARIAIKKAIKNEAVALTHQWLRRHAPKFDGYLMQKAEVVLTVYIGDQRRHDISNYSAKHFLDGVVSMRIIQDDSLEFIPREIKEFGGYADKSYAVFELREL